MLKYCGDVDIGLPGILAKGISTGIWESIPLSGVFSPENRERPVWSDIRSCFENWSSAEQEEDRVEALLEREIEQGWVERWPGSWEGATYRWGKKALCSKLALVRSEGKEDRLVGDSSAPNANPNARFP